MRASLPLAHRDRSGLAPLAIRASSRYDAEDKEEPGSFAGQAVEGLQLLSRRIYGFMSRFKQSGGLRKNEW